MTGNIEASDTPYLPVAEESTLPCTKTTQLPPLKTLNGVYELQAVIGSGGMGVIYRANHLLLSRQVAIKMLHAHFQSDNAWRRFQREAKATSSLNHPNIVSVFDFGVDGDAQPFMVLDWLDGETLSTRLRRFGALELDDCIELFCQICDGLEYAHGQGILHRDLKPSNFMLISRADGSTVVKIVDFGIAKVCNDNEEQLTRSGDIMGSPLYMSPEQAAGQPIDLRADIYSLGCALFEALTGVAPFIGDSTISVLFQHQSERPPSLREASMGKEFPPHLERLVATMLAKRKEDRPQSASVVKNELMRVKSGCDFSSELAASVGEAEATQRARRISIFRAGGIGAFALAIAVAAYMFSSSATKGSSNPEPSALAVAETDSSQEKVEERNELAAIINRNPSIKTLNCDNFRVTDAELAPIEKAWQLRDLDLNGTDITDKGISHIENLQLLSLGLAETGVTAAGLARLSHMNDLSRLNLEGVKLDEKGVECLAPFQKLKTLNIECTDLTDSELALMPKLGALENLSIGRTNVTDDGLQQLARYPQLASLSLFGLKIGRQALVHVSKLSKLGRLYLASTSIRDADLGPLCKMQSLKCLQLSRTQITDRALAIVARIPNLQRLYIEQCPNISASALQRFRRENPSVKVRDAGEL